MARRRTFLAWTAAAAAGGSARAGGHKLAILSGIGDAFTVVTYVPATGSHLDRNHHEVVALPRAEFDVHAIRVARKALERIDAAAVGDIVLAGALPNAVAKGLVDGRRFAPPADVAADLAAAGATRLLLFTRLRGPARLQLDSSATGSGLLEGLGFYVDRELRVRRSDTGEQGVGFLAPFAYFDGWLIDLASGDIIQRQSVQASVTFSAARSRNGTHPWDALDGRQKVAAIERLLQAEVSRMVPLLFAPN